MSDKTSRRKFLRRSAAIAAGTFVIPEIIPSTVLGMGGMKPPSDRLVIGVIGAGSQGMS
ncbi:MAG: twin-arginine translocation signal domain-containing protein, partial [Bacteroidales bacterium]|nr:twin-arginine translocation signal domain-containing protein [Bacteroidales bacterium]